jgi:spectinomycin phosphotransferase
LNGALWARIGGFTISLFPWVNGRRAADGGLLPQQWIELGAAARQIHAGQLPPELLSILPRERFVPSRRELVTRLDAVIDSPACVDPAQAALAGFWRVRRQTIQSLLARTDELGGWLRQRNLALVLCHADLHTWNVLVDTHQALWIVDWDEAILAPKERDLMFIVGGIGRDLVTPQETAHCLRGYGQVEIDPLALAYYRYAWAVQDMGAYAEQVFLGDASPQARRDAFDGFVDLFEPGNIVDIAGASP